MSTADARVEAAHTYLLLPFTTDILADPSPLLRTIYNASLSSQQSCALIFCSPKESSRKGIGGQQLYNILKASPRRHWSAFQLFLGKVYAALAAGQWEAGKVLMDVEVQFDEDGSRHEDWERRLLYAGKGVGRVLLLEGFQDLPVLNHIKPILGDHTTLILPSMESASPSLPEKATETETIPDDTGPFPVSALGGTFDHLHAAHKLLLHLALFLTARKLIVGVMAQHLLSSKNHSELVQPLGERIRGVEDFLSRIGGKTTSTSMTETVSTGAGIELNVVEIQDPFGPTAWDPDIQCLVVSRETLSGGKAVNAKRKEKGLGELEVFVIDVIAASRIAGEAGDGAGGGEDLRAVDDESKLKEMKMGSTAIRQWIKDHPREASSI